MLRTGPWIKEQHAIAPCTRTTHQHGPGGGAGHRRGGGEGAGARSVPLRIGCGHQQQSGPLRIVVSVISSCAVRVSTRGRGWRRWWAVGGQAKKWVVSASLRCIINVSSIMTSSRTQRTSQAQPHPYIQHTQTHTHTQLLPTTSQTTTTMAQHSTSHPLAAMRATRMHVQGEGILGRGNSSTRSTGQPRRHRHIREGATHNRSTKLNASAAAAATHARTHATQHTLSLCSPKEAPAYVEDGPLD